MRIEPLNFAGPVVITVAFIGDLVAGPAGARLAALGVFLPCSLFVIVTAPYFRRWARNAQLKAFVDGVTAAATGAIAGATLVLDGGAVVIAAATFLILGRARKIPEPLVIGAASVIGIVLHQVARWQVRFDDPTVTACTAGRGERSPRPPGHRGGHSPLLPSPGGRIAAGNVMSTSHFIPVEAP